RVLYALSGSGLIPVIAPIGLGKDGQTYNINADTMAGAIAGSVHASRLFMLTDVAGVMDKEGNLISELTEEEAYQAIADGVITGGMIPKIETCLKAVKEGAQAAVIMNGRIPHACLLELFTEGGSGTLIRGNH
ncbi:MAG: acetylglutamate kinase, partial [Commensalibacter sp.]|nr:acetylglutamate kinase [Commensalibacter sp.]